MKMVAEFLVIAFGFLVAVAILFLLVPGV